MYIFKKVKYKTGEILSCDCGNEIFEVIKDLIPAAIRWNNYLKMLNGHDFKVGQTDCRCNKCGELLDFRVKYK